jgi:hypothetical protein
VGPRQAVVHLRCITSIKSIPQVATAFPQA